jgi:Fe-S-cluster-containing dehydrogenase component
MQVGFVIDHRKCIGCHACTVACKAENDVPVGSFRTWVKYVDKGTFPSVRRHFTVLRCNHCDRAPCVDICPVNALHKRPDAIVDLDRDLCIGCRACMQACPYDALYFHPDNGVAEKCHYCAHRIERGLEPACVIVCPAEAIVSGDIADPDSKIARLLEAVPTSRRRLDKGTQPRVWYVDALPEALVPGATAEPASWLWSQRATSPPPEPAPAAPADVWTTLDVAHPAQWGWHVWLYLVTKNAAAGAALAAPFLAALGVRAGAARDVVPEIVALVFTAITSALLVHDLGRPERFWRLLLRPNPRSWLVRGAWVLMAFGAAVSAALGLRLAGLAAAADAARIVALPLAVLASGYSAWLFAQCRGRDLWIEPGLFGRLVLRAALLGAAVATLLPAGAATPRRAGIALALLAVANIVLLVVEMGAGRGGDTRPVVGRDDGARRARRILRRGARRVPLLLLAAAAFAVGHTLARDAGTAVVSAGLAAAAICIAMLVYERAWIRAGQAVPLS